MVGSGVRWGARGNQKQSDPLFFFFFFFLLTDGTLQGSYFLNLCKNLERNNLSGSLPAALLDKSKSGSPLLRSPFCHNFLCHISFSLLSHYK